MWILKKLIEIVLPYLFSVIIHSFGFTKKTIHYNNFEYKFKKTPIVEFLFNKR